MDVSRDTTLCHLSSGLGMSERASLGRASEASTRGVSPSVRLKIMPEETRPDPCRQWVGASLARDRPTENSHRACRDSSSTADRTNTARAMQSDTGRRWAKPDFGSLVALGLTAGLRPKRNTSPLQIHPSTTIYFLILFQNIPLTIIIIIIKIINLFRLI